MSLLSPAAADNDSANPPTPADPPAPAAASVPFCVEVLMPYADFPDLKRGDIVENPSEELLNIARRSNCFHVFPKPSAEPGNGLQPIV